MLEDEIRTALNRASAENDSDTPDFVLAGFLMDCLEAWNQATVARESFYSREVGGGKAIGVEAPTSGDTTETPVAAETTHWEAQAADGGTVAMGTLIPGSVTKEDGTDRYLDTEHEPGQRVHEVHLHDSITPAGEVGA